MTSKTSIEWTDKTWNPVTGCNQISPGCDNCYAKAFAERFRGVAGHPYEPGFDITLRPERLGDLEKLKRPRMVFVNSNVLSSPELPFGGVKSSGFGRELSELGIGEFVNRKLVAVS